MADFHRLVGAVLDSLYMAHGDPDTNVWMVADESVARLIKLHTAGYSELLCYGLVQLMQRKAGFVPTVRTLRSALRRFTELCYLLKPPRAKKYTGPVVAILSDLTRMGGDESIVEAIAACSRRLFRTFAFFFSAEQLATIDRLFVPLLSHASAPVRRSSAQCLVALCGASPVPRYTALMDALMEERRRSPESAALRHGVLMCMLNLVRDRRSVAADDEDPLAQIAAQILGVCYESVKLTDDHSAVGAALEVVLQLLTDHGTKGFLWEPGCAKLWSELPPVLHGLLLD
jgi:hypothetical protein